MKKFQFDLQRFNDGGSASSSAATSGGDSSANQNVAVNDGTGGQGANTNTETDEKSAWEAAKKQFKSFYDEDVKNHVTNRHKDYKALSKAKSEQDDFLNLMHARYGTSDLNGLRDAIDKDDGFWQDKADEANMTVPQFKEHLKLQAERDAAVRTVDTIRAQENAREQYNVWFEESKAVKEQYPEFDLNTELRNPQFRSMLSANYSKEFMPSMRQIYELIHRDEIMEKQKASVQKNTIDNIKARGLRPDEAGSDSGGAVDYTFDASKMSSKERADIARRVKAGESYTFKR